MAKPNVSEYSRVDEGGFLVEYAPESDTITGAPGTYAEVGCISGTPNFTDNFVENTESGTANNCELQNDDTDTEADYQQTQLGKRVGAVDYNVDMNLGSAIQTLMRSDYEAKKKGFLRVTAKDVGESVTKVIHDVMVKTPVYKIVPNNTERMQWNLKHTFEQEKPTAGWPTA